MKSPLATLLAAMLELLVWAVVLVGVAWLTIHAVSM